jgi:hypothetical protein
VKERYLPEANGLKKRGHLRNGISAACALFLCGVIVLAALPGVSLADTPISVNLTGWGWCLAYRDVGNVVLDLHGSEIPRSGTDEVVDLYLTGTLQFSLSDRTDTFDLELRGSRMRSLFFLKQVSGNPNPMIAEFEGTWLSDNVSGKDYIACEGRLATPVPNHLAKPYVLVLRTRDTAVPPRIGGSYVDNVDWAIQGMTSAFDGIADRLADAGSAMKQLVGDVLTRAAVIAREVRKLGTPYIV